MFGIDTWQPTGRPLIDRLTARVDLAISISRITLDRYLEWAPPPRQGTALLPNAIHLDDYGTGPKAPDLVAKYGLAGRTVLMTFGRIAASEQAKGFDQMIEILPRLRQRDPSLLYLVAGKGDDVARLKAKAASLGIADHVVFTGLIPEDRKADHYRLADIFALPSKGEGFGFVILEALACGVPAIASRTDGGYEALRNGMLGLAVDPANPDEIEAAVFAALDAPREIPAGLDYFAFPNFVKRLRRILFGANIGVTD
jgi:glycosyltransferase involved in cell wall biosynthesis